MDPLDVDDDGTQRLRDQHPHLIALVATVTDCAELATLAMAVPDLLAQWGVVDPQVQRGFRDVVRERYGELVRLQAVRP